MSAVLRTRLRDWRYGWPEAAGRRLPIQSTEAAAQACRRIVARGEGATLGYFALPEERPDAVAAALLAAARALASLGAGEAVLAVKAPPLEFDRGSIARIAAEGVPLVLDALTPAQAGRTLALAESLGCGAALPARWRRSPQDAGRLRDAPGRIRLVKGEWADPEGGPEDARSAYAALAAVLAGREAPVEVATHDPALAAWVLPLLQESGTPVELGQLRGLPGRRTRAIAKRLGVPVRHYHPYGPGWWPYAFEQALRRPHLPLWALRDLAGG